MKTNTANNVSRLTARRWVATLVLAAGLSGVAQAASHTFTALGMPYSEGMAINASGQVAGYYFTPGAVHAAVWDGSTTTALGTLGGPWSYAHAINASGQVAGYSYINPQLGGSYSSTQPTRAVVWNGTTATNLGTLGGTQSFAYAINDSGQVAGKSYTTGNATTRAVVWNGTTATVLDTLGGSYSSAHDINAYGQTVGVSSTIGTTAYRATIWNGTTATDLGTLGGTASDAAAINDSGQVVGRSFITGNAAFHATLWNGTAITDLGTLGGTSSSAFAINDTGQVVGYSYMSGDIDRHATLWNGTNAIDLNSFLDASTVSAGWVLNVARGINENGWIVGEASNSITGITSQAFLLSVTPVPEPEIYAMLLAGLALVGAAAKQRRGR